MSITLGPIFNAQNGKIREWRITINLFDANGNQIPITDRSIAISPGYYSEYFTVSGYSGMKMTTSATTKLASGKNIGKKNETSVLSQAIKECESKYAAKIKAGYTTVVNKPTDTNVNAMPFPMAVKSWKDQKNKLTYPLYIQPKLDGIRLLARLENDDVQLYTRRLRSVVGFVKLKQELKALFESSGLSEFIVDGELYSHGMNLQDISGIVRNESADEATKESLTYHVYDFFSIASPKLTFADRYSRLVQFMESGEPNMIILNPTSIAKTDQEATDLFNEYVQNGYEGVIYKSSNKPYEFSFNKEKRSAWYLKRKKQEDSEFAIVGYTHGNGKDKDCIVFTLQGPNGKTFNCVPNGTYEYRRALFAKANDAFDSLFLNKLAKVLYDDLSKDGIPLRGRIIQIDRDISFD